MRKERQTRIRFEKFLAERVIRRMKKFDDARNVYFGVFGSRVIPVNQERGKREQQEQRGFFSLHAANLR